MRKDIIQEKTDAIAHNIGALLYEVRGHRAAVDALNVLMSDVFKFLEKIKEEKDDENGMGTS